MPSNSKPESLSSSSYQNANKKDELLSSAVSKEQCNKGREISNQKRPIWIRIIDRGITRITAVCLLENHLKEQNKNDHTISIFESSVNWDNTIL